MPVTEPARCQGNRRRALVAALGSRGAFEHIARLEEVLVAGLAGAATPASHDGGQAINRFGGVNPISVVEQDVRLINP